MPDRNFRFEGLVLPILLSLLMSGLVAVVAVVRVTGSTPAFSVWFSDWLSAWVVVFPALLLVQPIVDRAVGFLAAQTQGQTARHPSYDFKKDSYLMDATTKNKDALQDARLETLHRFYGAFSSGDASNLDHSLIADWDEEPRNQGQGPGRESMKQFIAGVRRALPDLTIEIKEVVFDDEKAAVRAEMRGTHTQDFFGVAATGKPYAIRLHEFHAFQGSQIAYTWHMEDWFGFLNQVGAWPVAPAGDEQ